MSQRMRRTPQEAQALILDAAEQLLVEGGPSNVQVRAVAQRVGMTDAGITHHFGNRDGLLIALLRHGGRRIRQAVTDAADGWLAGGRPSVEALVDAIADVYDAGYGELAVALHAAGWRDEGHGMLAEVVDALQVARKRHSRTRPLRRDTELAVAALHQALATEPLYGSAFRRSAGMTGDSVARDAQTQRRWWAHTIRTVLDIPSH